jgi:peptidoglycan L-alanyl-D-glutamate endopeptidase CwlK
MTKYSYGRRSAERLATVDDDLRRVLERALGYGLMDIAITQGVRSKEDQERFFAEKKTKVHWPDSKHNVLRDGDLAKAVDAAPYVNGRASYNHSHCCFLAGLVLAAAAELGVTVRWGGNWDMDGEPVTDQDFQDLVHFEKRG